MTAEQLQDALTLLPNDLVTATDRLRTAPKPRVIHWKRLVPAAACLVVLVSGALLLRDMPARSDSTAQAPAAAAPMEMAKDEAAPQEAPAADVPANGSTAITGGNAAAEAEENINDGHRHLFAEEAKTESGASPSWCGNAQARVTLEGTEYTLGGADAIELTAILEALPYDPAWVCRCAPEFTVDTELLTDIEVSLTNAFARCEKGQASLTEAQVHTIQEIIDGLK